MGVGTRIFPAAEPSYVGHGDLEIVERIVDFQIPADWDGSIDIPTLAGLGLVLGCEVIATCGANPGFEWRNRGHRVVWVPGEGIPTNGQKPASFDREDGGDGDTWRQLDYTQVAIQPALLAGARLRFRVVGTIAAGVDPWL